MTKLLFAALFVFTTVFPAYAAKDIKYSRSQRLAILDDEAGDASLNVTLQQVDYNELPEFMAAQISRVAHECTSSVDNAKKTKVYSYFSDYHRRKKLPPNYIVDMMPLLSVGLKSCSMPAMCLKGYCNLWGYEALGENIWTRSFILKTRAWELKTVSLSSGLKMTQSYLDVVVRSDDCAALGGVPGRDDDCQLSYMWRSRGLSSVRHSPISVDSPKSDVTMDEPSADSQGQAPQ